MANYWNQRIATAGFNPGEMSAMLRLKGLMWVAYLLGTLGIAVGLGFEHISLLWIALLGVLQGLMFLNLLLRSGLAGQQKFVLEGLLSAGDKAIMILLSIPLLQGQALWTGNILNDFIIIQIIGALTITILSGFLYRSHTKSPVHHPHSDTVRTEVPQELHPNNWWRAWVPFGVMGLLMTAYFRMDVVFLRLWGNYGALDQGWYAASYRLLDAGMMLPLLLGQMWVGRFAFLERNLDKIHTLLNESVKLLLGIGFIALFTGLPRIEEWMAWWYPASGNIVPIYRDGVPALPAYQILTWHLLAFLPMSLNVVLGSVLTAHRSFGKLIPLHAGALLLNLILLRLWVPEWGAVGAAMACTLTHTTVMIAQWILVMRQYSWKPWSKLWKTIVSMSLAGIILVYTFGFLNHPLGIWQEGLITGLGLGLVWTLMFPKTLQLR
jgi:O-antigen/teichoic acid export membrane protein